jgi:pterin-4a-carbinolamine dehydratase
MGELKIILKQKRDYIKKTKQFTNYSEDIAIANKIISRHTNNCPCPEILVKCKSMLNGAKQKLLFCCS